MVVKERYLEIVYFPTVIFLAILLGYGKGLNPIEWMVKKGRGRCRAFSIKKTVEKHDSKVQK